MATNYINTPKVRYREIASYIYPFRKHSDFTFIMSLKNARLVLKSSKRGRGSIIQYCTSTSTSSTEELLDGKRGYEEEGQFEYLANEYGWKVRKLDEEESEIRRVAYIQSQAFYEPMRFFNSFFFEIFQAEVLAGLLYRLRNSPRDRYACLVAEPNTEVTKSHSSELVGVVDVTAMRETDVLHDLPGAQEYLYVSGIAVLNNFRRRRVATALLKACDMLLNAWGFEYLVLRAYEDDMGALKLYGNAGYDIVSGDPPWMSTWIGRRRRVVMIKRPNVLQNEIPKTQP